MQTYSSITHFQLKCEVDFLALRGEVGVLWARRGLWEGQMQAGWTSSSSRANTQLHSALLSVRTHLFSSFRDFYFLLPLWRTGSPVDCGCCWSFSWDAIGCRLSTWTPTTSCGRTGILAACSASLSPCTGSFNRRIRECKNWSFILKGGCCRLFVPWRHASKCL